MVTNLSEKIEAILAVQRLRAAAAVAAAETEKAKQAADAELLRLTKEEDNLVNALARSGGVLATSTVFVAGDVYYRIQTHTPDSRYWVLQSGRVMIVTADSPSETLDAPPAGDSQ